MRRREFIGALGIAAAAWPFTAGAQSRGMRKIGALLTYSEKDPEAGPRVKAFLGKLSDIGWKEGRDFNFDARFGGSGAGPIGTNARDLVRSAPDVILVQSNLALTALLKETRDIPIVFTVIGDPVGSGFIASLARPGGNATGFTSFEPPLFQKSLQSLKEIAPRVRRVGTLFNPETAANEGFLRAAQAASGPLGMETVAIEVRNAGDIERAVEEFAHQPDGGLLVLPSPITNEHRELIVAFAARHRLPAVYSFRYFALGGGLMSYGINVVDLYERAATYVDRILKGEKPSELPAQQPTKFELVINLRTANTLGLTVPPTLLAGADEVIE